MKSCGRAVHCVATQSAYSLFVLEAGRARGPFFELNLKTCPEVGVILTPLRRDTFSMVLVLPDTGEYEPQALSYHYILRLRDLKLRWIVRAAARRVASRAYARFRLIVGREYKRAVGKPPPRPPRVMRRVNI